VPEFGETEDARGQGAGGRGQETGVTSG